MNNKNIQLIKQNVYIMQFIYIMNAFINKLLEKTIKKNHSLNKTQIFNSLHENIFSLLKKMLIQKKYKLKKIKIRNNVKIKCNINKKIKETINKLLEILKLLSKYQVKNKNDRHFIRSKKRINNNKFNNRKNINDG
jgi:fucose permease